MTIFLSRSCWKNEMKLFYIVWKMIQVYRAGKHLLRRLFIQFRLYFCSALKS